MAGLGFLRASPQSPPSRSPSVLAAYPRLQGNEASPEAEVGGSGSSFPGSGVLAAWPEEILWQRDDYPTQCLWLLGQRPQALEGAWAAGQ